MLSPTIVLVATNMIMILLVGYTEYEGEAVYDT